MADDLGERTEEATPKRRQESRQEGQVPRSQDLTGALLLVAGTLAVTFAATWMLEQGAVTIGAVLAGASATDPLDPDEAWTTVMFVGGAAVRVLTPIILVAFGAALLTQLGQVGILFAPKAVQPKASRISPLAGFHRVFGVAGLVKATMDSLKVLVVMLVAVLTVLQHYDKVLLLPYLSVLECLRAIGTLMLDLALRALAVLLLLGVIDYAYQRWKFSKDLRMTKQQVKDEMRQTEGDPDVKRRRMRMQQQIALQRISSAVPKADVVVTNPEHISIAIQYDDAVMSAPRVVAKGADYVALRIRQIALKHGIPIVERKPLARALYRDVPVGREIPPDFYAAVAEVLAYVYRLNGRMAS